MAAPVQVQQLPKAGAGLPPPAMAPPRPAFGHQARRLQGLFHKGVSERHPMLRAGPAHEVPDIEASVVLPIQPEQALHLGHIRPLGRRRLPSAIQQGVTAKPLVHQSQPPNAAGAAPQDVGRLQPRELSTQRSQDDLVHFHGALHGGGAIGHGHLLGDQFSPTACWKRSFPVLSGAAKSCAPYRTPLRPLTGFRHQRTVAQLPRRFIRP